MTRRASSFLRLRRLLVLLMSLLWATMSSAAAVAERGDFDQSLIAAKTTGDLVKQINLNGRLDAPGLGNNKAVIGFFGWGSKTIDKLLFCFTREGLEAAGLNADKLRSVADGYRKLGEITPKKSAPQRAEQLEQL